MTTLWCNAGHKKKKMVFERTPHIREERYLTTERHGVPASMQNREDTGTVNGGERGSPQEGKEGGAGVVSSTDSLSA